MTSALITLICRLCFSFSSTSPYACDRSCDRVRRQALGNLRVSSDGLRVAEHTQGDRLTHTSGVASSATIRMIHAPRFHSFFLYLAFFLSSRLCLKPLCRRDLNIAFMLHRVTRRCLLRKPSFFITWKFISRPLNRDEAKKKNSSHNWSCGDRDDV